MKFSILLFGFLLFSHVVLPQHIEKLFGCSFTHNCYDASPTSDNGFITVSTPTFNLNEPIITKIDSLGNKMWAKKLLISTLISGDAYIVNNNFQIIESNQGGYLFYTSLTPSSGTYTNTDGLIIKLDSNGNVIWNLKQKFLMNEYYPNSRIQELPSGDIILFKAYISCLFFARISPTGLVYWSKTVSADSSLTGKNPGFDFISLPDESVVISGKSNWNNCFARFDSLGNLIWSKIFDFGSSYNQPRGITLMDDGNLLVVGTGTLNYILKINSNTGDVIWRKDISGGDTPEDVISIGSDKYLYASDSSKALYKINGDGNFIAGINFDVYNLTQNFGMFAKFKKLGDNIYYSSQGSNSISNSSIMLSKIDTSLNYFCSSPEIISTSNTTLPLNVVGSLYSVNNGTYSVDSVNTVMDSLNIIQQDLCPLVGLEKQNNIDPLISIYPNPVEKNEFLVFESFYKNNLISIYNLSFKKIMSISFSGKHFQLPLNNFERGVYLIKVNCDNDYYHVQKIIIE